MSNLAALPIESEIDSRIESEPNALAVQVEEARKELLSTLLELKQTSTLVAQKLVTDLDHGTDCSELIVTNNSGDFKKLLEVLTARHGMSAAAESFGNEHSEGCQVVQERNVVQLIDVEWTAHLWAGRSVNILLYNLHLLPTFLLDCAKQAEQQLSTGELADGVQKARIANARRTLSSRRQQMIASNTGLVAFVARKYKTSNLSFEDLMQEGLVGLIKAVDRFDPQRGICFSTYAIYWIRQAISRLIVKQEKIVRLPVALAEKASSVFEMMRQYYTRNERWPSITELKAGCDLSEQELKTLSSYYQATFSLDTPLGDDEDGLDLMTKMQQNQFSLPLDELIDQDLAQYVDKAVASLPEKQAAILTMRFGLRDHTEMTLQAVADQLHVTRERVRQIQNDALKKLKQQFGFDLMLFLEPKDG